MVEKNWRRGGNVTLSGTLWCYKLLKSKPLPLCCAKQWWKDGCRDAAGVWSSDTMCHFVCFTLQKWVWLLHQPQHSCDSAQSDTFLAQLLSFSSWSHWVVNTMSLSPVLYAASVSHFTGRLKGCMKSQVHRNLQNVPCSQSKKKSLQIRSSFTRIKGNSSRLRAPSSRLFSLNRNQSKHSVSCLGSKTTGVAFWEWALLFCILTHGLTVFTIHDKWHLRGCSSSGEKTRCSAVVFCGSTTWYAANRCFSFIFNLTRLLHSKVSNLTVTLKRVWQGAKANVSPSNPDGRNMCQRFQVEDKPSKRVFTLFVFHIRSTILPGWFQQMQAHCFDLNNLNSWTIVQTHSSGGSHVDCFPCANRIYISSNSLIELLLGHDLKLFCLLHLKMTELPANYPPLTLLVFWIVKTHHPLRILQTSQLERFGSLMWESLVGSKSNIVEKVHY